MNVVIGFVTMIVLCVPSVAFGHNLSSEIKKAMERGAEAKFCLKICDDLGLPVSSASVKVEFDFLPSPHSVYGVTDLHGLFVASGKTNGNKIRFLVGKNGYYGSHKELSYIRIGEEHDVKDGKWQPYGDVMKILLRPIKNPRKLETVTVRHYTYTDAIGEWIGYDLKLHDFVKPYGSGEISDFEIYLDWDRVYSFDSKKIGFKVRFQEPMSGFYSTPTEKSSDFQTPYVAVTDKILLKDAEFYDRYDGKRIGRTFDRSRCWVIRSRCKLDHNGELISANYSVVQFLGISGRSDLKAGFSFIGAFNSTPNDVNLENLEVAMKAHAFILQCETSNGNQCPLSK